MKELPSPEQLRNQIIIKAKKFVHGVSNTLPSTVEDLEDKKQQNGENETIHSTVPDESEKQACDKRHLEK